MKEINVVGAAIKDGDKFLAAQRSEKMNNPLKWEFAGGKTEPGETYEQALKRELWEELGIRVNVGDFLAVGYSETETVKITLYVYEARIIEGEPTAKEHKQITWINIRDLKTLDWAEADIPACEKLVEMYGNKSN